ncbi:MAG TPA: GerMN domain-containing protein [Blastocatellia bacterium]|nr:GerMN domain-containing protein [Blastocatellia bacterium]
MKTTRVIPVLAAALIVAAALMVNGAQQQRNGGKRLIWIYLYPGDESADENRALSQRAARENVLALVPVQRSVSVAAPARGALEALIAGPTEEEKKRGLLAPYTEGLSIDGLTINAGTAKVSFTSANSNGHSWPGDLAVWRFTEAVTRTLKQFQNVRRVVICLDGYEDFGSLADEPSKKCP